MKAANTFRRYLVIPSILIGLFSAGLIHAQGPYSIKGRILDAATKETLPGANLLILGTSIAANSDENGAFVLDQIASSKCVLVASYIGYKSDTLVFEFSNQNSIEKTIQLKASAVLMDQIEVTGKLQGQMKATHDQLTATSIKNIVAAEQMLKFPDLNAAEAIARIPGITLQRDQGEGRFVQLRGTPPELSNFSVNGEQIPSPEGNVRYVGLDVVPLDQVASIEISKALTPDQDGDAIGGSINLITRMAQDTIPEIHAALAGGYNHLSEKPQYNTQFAFGQRIKKFGFYANGSFLEDNRASHSMEFNFNESRFGGDTTFRIHYDIVQLRHYEITRKRTGLSGTWDYQPNRNHLFSLNLLYNRFSDQEFRRRVRYNIGGGFLLSETSSREAEIERDLRDREKYRPFPAPTSAEGIDWDPWSLDYTPEPFHG
ncbi:MAG: carboxypeptidase-like regulatory domain-containing protein [Saprospirales bacterium]|nr:carboxypeptidase-like regulatory domain-containing protein [Saprospirales bacterium]